MANVAQTTQPFADAGTIAAAWRMSRDEIEDAKIFVQLDVERIPDLLCWMKPQAPSNAWRSYVGFIDDAAPDLPRLFFELALTISQFGGFVQRCPDGSIRSWKFDGSGVKALLKTIDYLRANRGLPCIDIHDRLREKISCYFMGGTFAKQRIDMICEIAEAGIATFADHLTSARHANGSFSFGVEQLEKITQTLPKSFGGDTPFHKKASLLLMTMSLALNQLGVHASCDTIPPADYRIPQILEGFGILKYRSDLEAKIAGEHLFRLNDREVRAIRTMTVEAVQNVHDAIVKSGGGEVSYAEVDCMLYHLSRETRLMRLPSMHQHVLVETLAF